MRSLAVVVPRSEAEAVRRRLLEAGLLDTSFRIGSEGDALLLPVRSRPEGGWPVREADLEPVRHAPRTYRDVCRVPEALRDLLPTAYDQVGDILLLKLPEPLLPHAAEVGRALLEVQANARVVGVDGGVKGPFRVRDVRLVAGEPRTETVHREHGVRLRVDVARAYFSPRLGTERLRVARLVRPGEIVVDLFSGVGPLALLIARAAPSATVYAVDANPEAFRALRENVRVNRAGNVRAVLGDAAEFLSGFRDADRIVLDLPHGAAAFLPAALRSLRRGGMIHLYEILDAGEREARARDLAAFGEAEGRPITVTGIRSVHAYSATQSMFAFDLGVS